MKREDILQDVLQLGGSNWLLELPTGTGKSKIALEKIKQTSHNGGTLLIVVPRNVHKTNWALEIGKWWPDCELSIMYTTYVSFTNMRKNWDFVIFDECHHLSERCREALSNFNIKHSILLSATVNKDIKDDFKVMFNNLVVYTKKLRDVIENEILPDPTVYLLPLLLETKLPTESLWFNKKAKGRLIECSWAERWKFIKQKNCPVRVYCTEYQYYLHISKDIDYWKSRYMRTKSQIARNKWLRLSLDRLKWLSDRKTGYVLRLLHQLNDKRTLTFCGSIEQTKQLGEYCINSKNKDSLDNYNKFNNGEINHITACNMLNESMNLVDCQVGIYANLNSSETIIKQRAGRLLRHPKPVIIIPYFKNTRDEELVNKMLEDYNPKLIRTINDFNEIEV